MSMLHAKNIPKAPIFCHEYPFCQELYPLCQCQHFCHRWAIYQILLPVDQCQLFVMDVSNGKNYFQYASASILPLTRFMPKIMSPMLVLAFCHSCPIRQEVPPICQDQWQACRSSTLWIACADLCSFTHSFSFALSVSHSFTILHTPSHSFLHTLSAFVPHTHLDSYSHSLSQSLSFSLSLNYSHFYTLTVTLTGTHSYLFTLTVPATHSHSLTFSHTHVLSLTHAHAHTHTHVLYLTFKHAQNIWHILFYLFSTLWAQNQETEGWNLYIDARFQLSASCFLPHHLSTHPREGRSGVNVAPDRSLLHSVTRWKWVSWHLCYLCLPFSVQGLNLLAWTFYMVDMLAYP